MEFFYYLSDREHIILIFDSTKSIITNGKIIDIIIYNLHYFTGFKQHKIVDLPACIVSSGSFRHFLAS